MKPDHPSKPSTQESARRRTPRRSPSMHEDVELWCDCCSCEPEPRWQAIEEELASEAARPADRRDPRDQHDQHDGRRD